MSDEMLPRIDSSDREEIMLTFKHSLTAFSDSCPGMDVGTGKNQQNCLSILLVVVYEILTFDVYQ